MVRSLKGFQLIKSILLRIEEHSKISCSLIIVTYKYLDSLITVQGVKVTPLMNLCECELTKYVLVLPLGNTVMRKLLEYVKKAHSRKSPEISSFIRAFNMQIKIFCAAVLNRNKCKFRGA